MLPQSLSEIDESTAVVAEAEPTDKTGTDSPWHVVLFNDDVHTFDEVIHQLVKAIGCSVVTAESFAWDVHTKGKATVYEDELEPCLRVQSVLREIELITEVRG